jgi:hypothetical protein
MNEKPGLFYRSDSYFTGAGTLTLEIPKTKSLI